MKRRLPLLQHGESPLAFRVALGYVLVGALWILFSDRLLQSVAPSPETYFRLQTYKGWGFILVTGIAVFLLVRHYVLQLRSREHAVRELVLGVSERTGEAFFRSLTEHLALALDVEFAYVGELTGDKRQEVRPVARYNRGGVGSEIACSLERTPCEEVLRSDFFHVSDGVQEQFPADRRLQELNIRGYMGTLLRDSMSKPLGLLVIMSTRPLRQEYAAGLLKIFAVRSATELERKRAEDALRGQFEQITTIFDSLNALVYVVDMEDHAVIYMNRYGQKIFGEKWSGRHCYEILQEGSDPCRFCSNEELKDGGIHQKPLIWEYRNKVNGKWYQCIDKGIRWPDGRLVRLEIAIDITERKEMERLKDEILSAVSHEMRTPLTAVLGYAEYLLENEVPPEERQGYLRILHQEADRLSDLINDFLQLQRLQARRFSYKFTPLPVSELLEQAARPFSLFTEQPAIRIEAPVGLPPVRGEEKSLLEVLEKLIANAVKYSPRGGEIVLGAELRDDRVLLFVRDRGQGIPASELERIFDRFYRIDNSDRRLAGGAGLGLALVREIVRAHGGEVWAESALAQGSTFFVDLPAALKEG